MAKPKSGEGEQLPEVSWQAGSSMADVADGLPVTFQGSFSVHPVEGGSWERLVSAVRVAWRVSTAESPALQTTDLWSNPSAPL